MQRVFDSFLRTLQVTADSTLEGVEIFRIDAGLVAEQKHQDRQTDGRLGRCHCQDEEHEHLSVHVTQIAGEGHEVHVDGQEHQLDGHQQHDQVLAVQKNANDGEREQHGAQRQVMAQSQRHAFVSTAVVASAAGDYLYV